MNESISDTENDLDKEQQVTLSNSSSLSNESTDKVWSDEWERRINLF